VSQSNVRLLPQSFQGIVLWHSSGRFTLQWIYNHVIDKTLAIKSFFFLDYSFVTKDRLQGVKERNSLLFFRTWQGKCVVIWRLWSCGISLGCFTFFLKKVIL